MSHRNTWAQRWRWFIHRMISISNVLQSFSLHLIRATQMCSNTTITTHSSKHTRAKRSLSWMLAFLKFSKQKFSVALTLLEAGKIKQQTRLNFTSNYNTASNQTGNLRHSSFKCRGRHSFLLFSWVYTSFLVMCPYNLLLRFHRTGLGDIFMCKTYQICSEVKTELLTEGSKEVSRCTALTHWHRSLFGFNPARWVRNLWKFNAKQWNGN